MTKLESLNQFIVDINLSNSRNYKLDVLKKINELPNAEFIKYALEYVFNPYKITGISDKKMNREVTSVQTDDLIFSEPEELLEWILENNNGSDLVLSIINFNLDFLCQNENERNLMKSIIIKDFNIGVSTTSINKIFPGLIPEFNLMLAEKYNDNIEYLKDKIISVTKKLDGNRCLLFIDQEGHVSMFTRQGLPYEGLLDIEAEAARTLPKGFVYDGELIANVEDNLTTEERYRLTTGTLHKKSKEKKGLAFMIFDMIAIDEFKNQKGEASYHLRSASLRACHETKHIKILPVLYTGPFDEDIVAEIATELTDAGEEGAMINVTSAPYQFRRTKELLKVKKFNTADVEVIATYEGTGNFVGTLGGVTVKFIAPDGEHHTANVGSGFSLDLRHALWEAREDLIGTIIEIKYFEISQNKEGKYSLRFPVFKDLRLDKTEISMY